MARVLTIVQTSSSIPTTSGISIVISQSTNPGSVVGGISDTAYNATTWDGVTTDAPSKNAVRDKIVTMDAAIALNTAKNSYPSGDATKVGYITVTQAVDLDTIESDTTANNAKVTNATHTGEVTGSGALVINKTAISNKTIVTYDAAADYVLITDGSDSDNLKKVLIPAGGGGLSYFTEALTTAAPNATINATSLTASGGSTNQDAAFIPKGSSGSVLVAIPDNTTTGGNKRGTASVDLQLTRTAASQVVSGSYSFGVGARNTVSGDWSGAIGFNNNVSGYSSFAAGESNTVSNGPGIAIGSSNTVSGSYSAALGRTHTVSGINSFAYGESNTASTSYTFAGGLKTEAHLYGEQVFGAGRFASTGDAQAANLLWRNAITGTGATELFLDGASIRAILKSGNTVWNTTIQVVATIQTVGNGTVTLGDSFVGTYAVGIKRIGSSTALIGTVDTVSGDNDTGMAGAAVTITADDTNEALKIEFTPPTLAGTTTVTRVVARGTIAEVRY